MKISHLFLLLGIALFTACQDDDNTIPDGATILKYDNENVTGPLLDPGQSELAIRFPASTMAEHVGKKLTEVQVFVGNLPDVLLIRVYGEGTTSEPGQKLFELNALSTTTPGQWNKYNIAGLDITGEDLWMGVFVEHSASQPQNFIGCDSGPRKTNADWLFTSGDLSWLTYQERTNESVNWNIRGVVE